MTIEAEPVALMTKTNTSKWHAGFMSPDKTLYKVCDHTHESERGAIQCAIEKLHDEYDGWSNNQWSGTRRMIQHLEA